MRQVVQNLALVPTVVAAGEDSDVGLQQLFSNARSDAKASGGVFTIGNDQIDVPLRHQIGEAVVDDLPPRRADDVTNEKYAHRAGRQLKLRPNTKMERTA